MVRVAREQANAELMWTCQRQSHKRRCGHKNSNRRQLCEACGKRKPPRKVPAHMAALRLPYEAFVEVNDGEFCGICGREPEPGKRFHRDHDHRTGKPRGILCFPCNLQLKHSSTVEWLRAAANYLERAA